MLTSVVLLVFMCTCIITVQAKAVSKEPKHVTFQGIDSSSPIKVIPQWYTTSNQPALKIAKEVNEFLELREGKGSIPQETNLPVFQKGNSEKVKHDNKYDLSYHESLDSVFDLNSDSPKSQVNSKRQNRPSSGLRNRKLKDHIRKQKSDVFLDDQVFIEKNKMRRNPQKVRSVDAIKPDAHAFVKGNSKSTTVEEDLSCDLESLKNREFVPVGNTEKDNSRVHKSMPQLNNRATPATNANKRIKKRELPPETIEDISSIETLIQDSVNNLPKNTIKLIKEGHSEAKNNFKDLNEGRAPSVTRLESKPKIEQITQNIYDPISVEIPVKNSPINAKQLVEDTNDPKKDLNSEDKHLLRDDVTRLFDNSFRSYVFNPQAEPREKFQECTTRKNETGYCRYVQHCMLPSLLGSIQQFLDNVCVIEERFVGVCCPEFPVSILQVNWPNTARNVSHKDEPLNTPEDCGVGTNTRIVGGSNADRKAWPWMVALLNNRNKFFCGGSLINNRYVLTAAHCTVGPPSNQIIARLGEYDFKNPRDPHDDYFVTEIKQHGQFTRFPLRNDIALLKLDRPAVFNEFVKTVCLPNAQEIYLDRMATLVGWGHLNGVTLNPSDVLQEASFPIITNIQCTQTHGISVPSSMICAAAPSKDKSACNGDSGGPLMLLDNERWRAIGIVSWGRRGCSPRFPTVYTSVTHFLDWIEKYAV